MGRKKYQEDREQENRFESSRSMESRQAQIRDRLKMMYADPMYVDPTHVPDGMEYCWIRESIRNEPDDGNIVDMKRKGWTPVPAERHPDMAFDNFMGRMNHMKGFIFHKGSILCERPKELGDIERKTLNERNHKIMNSMPGTENFMGEPTMPGRYLANNTTRGVDFGR